MLLNFYNPRNAEANLPALKTVLKQLKKLNKIMETEDEELSDLSLMKKEETQEAIVKYIQLKAYVHLAHYYLWKLDLLKKIRFVFKQERMLYSNDSVEF